VIPLIEIQRNIRRVFQIAGTPATVGDAGNDGVFVGRGAIRRRFYPKSWGILIDVRFSQEHIFTRE
jgi:hypothetical protein